MKGRLVEPFMLDPATRDSMVELLDRWFEGVSPTGFETDLADKTHVILLEEDGGLMGFSTLAVESLDWRGTRYRVVYSGDTVVDPSAWGRSILSAFWIDAVWSLCPEDGGLPIWLLLTSGFRTYRFLPVFWREFHPRRDRKMPERMRQLRDFLAQARYGDLYDASTGIVRFVQPQRLRGDLAGIPPERIRNPHVAFFARANPRHASGDELVCLTELTPRNLTSAGRRMVAAGAKLRNQAVADPA